MCLKLCLSFASVTIYIVEHQLVQSHVRYNLFWY